MDNFGFSDRICEMDESDIFCLLDTGMDSETFDSAKMDLNYELSQDWLPDIFECPVLNDKMITEASESPAVKSEHNYSNGKQSNEAAVILSVKAEPASQPITLDENPGPSINPKFLEMTASDINAAMLNQPLVQKPRSIQTVTVTKQEPKIIFKNEPIIIEARRPCQQQSLLKSSTILLTKQNQPKMDVTLQRMDSQMTDADSDEGICLNVMPMTPPGSGSDSESAISPIQSPTPSPVRQVVFKSSHREINPATAIYSQPIPTSGILMLTEEEKRTLIAEGYPIPSKLPLSKIEEKNLKKVRRKIKNKISAQESRRKRKEYMDHLEKKMEDMTRENTDLRKKCDKYEQSNQSLISQLNKLQNLLKKLAPHQGTAQTGICLMVLVLCFAVFFGDWIPYSFSSGYGLTNNVQTSGLSNANTLDLYTSSGMKPSRTLLAAVEEEQSCGVEPWPLTLARKSIECISNFIMYPQSDNSPGSWSNASDQQFLFTGLHESSMKS